MATITPTNALIGGNLQITWAAMAGGDVGAAYTNPAFFRLASVQYDTGTWGTSTLTIQGSNDDTNYYTLADPQGNALSKIANGLEVILEAPLYYRPSFGAGTGSALSVVLAFTARQPG